MSSGVSVGPPLRPRTRRQKLRSELRILRRDGLVKYVRTRRALHRFHRSLERL